MGWLNANEKRLRKKLRNAEKAHEAYTRALDSLKDTYLEIYNRDSIEFAVEVIKEVGHYTEINRVEEFYTRYKGGNIDEIDISFFKKLFDTYSNDILEKRSKKGE